MSRLRVDYPRTATRRAVEAVGGLSKAATICGVTPVSVQSWLRAGRVPGLHEALALAQAARMDVWALDATAVDPVVDPTPSAPPPIDALLQ